MAKKIYHEEEIVPECEGCSRIIEGLGKGSKRYCACYPYPKIHWWGGCKCPSATHLKIKPEEDPTEEGKYENKKKDKFFG